MGRSHRSSDAGSGLNFPDSNSGVTSANRSTIQIKQLVSLPDSDQLKDQAMDASTLMALLLACAPQVHADTARDEDFADTGKLADVFHQTDDRAVARAK